MIIINICLNPLGLHRWQVGEVNRRRLCAQDNVASLSYNCLFLFLHLPLSRSKLDGVHEKNPHYMRGTEFL
jgi:hypothetical protein